MCARPMFAALLVFSLISLAAAHQIRPEEGRAQVPWDQAQPLVGQTASVFGKVIDVNTAGRVTFVNFDAQRPARFAGVIFREQLGNFPKPPKEMYEGKIVRINGVVSTFKDAPQIVVAKPDQIEVLDVMPETILPNKHEPPKVNPEAVVIGAYNILNLFDEHDDPYREDEGTPAKPRAELERLAESIKALNADVLAVEEVENRDYLQRFVDVFLPEMGYKDVVLFEGNDGRGIDVGLISRIPVGKVESNRHVRFPGHAGGEDRFQRDILEVTLEPEGAEPFEAWVLHLKSNSGGREASEPIRLAEAREVRRMLDEELTADPRARILLMGDFNDTWSTPTLTTIAGESEGALFSVGSELNDPSIVTYNKGEFRSVIDFILCSPAMAEQFVKGSVRVPQGSVDSTGSDHNPITATFKLK